MAPKNTTSRDSHHDTPSLHGSCDQQPSVIRECAPLVGLRNVTLAKSIENHSENRSKIDPQRRLGAPKSESKSLPGPSRETPWRERAPRRPPGVPGESQRATGDARKGTLERLGARRGDQNRRQVASESGKIEFSSCCAFAKHRRSNWL